VVAFVFAIFFLVCAGLAIGVRTGNLGLGASAPDGAWVAGTVLAVAGVIGVIGTLANLRRPSTASEAGGAPAPAVEPTAPASEMDRELAPEPEPDGELDEDRGPDEDSEPDDEDGQS
jgi:hypothetical protein